MKPDLEPFKNIEQKLCMFHRQRGDYMYLFKRLEKHLYSFYTGFPQILWKTFKSPAFSGTCIVFLACFLLLSCSYTKKITGNITGKPQPQIESSLISMTESDVRKKLGEPTMVSLTPESKILWTYRPDWRLMPDNKDTVYIEFEDGKVTKVIKANR